MFMKKNNIASTRFITLGLLGTAVLFGSALFVSAAVYSPITSQLNPGTSGLNVTNLQVFLAANPSIYPEGIVTGYYGLLTKTAIIRFQAQYGLEQVGRVGPMTLAKINSLIVAGGWTTIDGSGPAISSITQSVTQNSATFTWNTNEIATGKIFYGTTPVTMNEGDINSVGFGSTNGSVAVNDNLARTSQQVSMTNLQPNTTYYYTIVSTDLTGNVSVWNPNGTFKTN